VENGTELKRTNGEERERERERMSEGGRKRKRKREIREKRELRIM